MTTTIFEDALSRLRQYGETADVSEAVEAHGTRDYFSK